jgi:hypothetical protein
MKTQAWGWLAVAALAAGLNASYHDGGLQWAHQIVDQVGHNTSAVLALATGRADQFMAEAQLVTRHKQNSECPLTAALARMDTSMPSDFEVERFEMISAREQAQLARLEANRARIEAQVSRIRIPAMAFRPVVVAAPKLSVCPRVRVNIPRIPAMKMPVIHIAAPEAGSV